MANYVVSSGVTSSGNILNSGDTEDVLSGGVAEYTAVNSGAVEYISSGGRSFEDTVYSGGTMSIYASGGVTSLSVSAGAVATGAGTILSGSTDYGTISDMSVGSPGPDFGFVEVESGGVVQRLVIENGFITVSSGALASDTVIASSLNAGNALYVEGSAVSTTVLRSGFVGVGGRDSDATVSSGGDLYIESGGVDTDSVISYGGSAQILSGAITKSLHVLSGGKADLAAVISSGQTVVLNSSETSRTVIQGVIIDSGGVLRLDVSTILSGGTLSIPYGTSISNVYVSAGGTLTGAGVVSGDVSVAGVLDGVTMDGMSELQSGARAIDIVAGGYVAALSGATVTGARLSGGDLQLSAGAVASETTVAFYGSAEVYGLAVSTVISSLGTQYVQRGGVAQDTAILGGGTEYVFGTTSGSDVHSSGIELIQRGGANLSATVSSGGTEVVSSGGDANGVTVDDGGLEVLSLGAGASGIIVSSGGAVELTSVGLGGVTVLSGSVLELPRVMVSSGSTFSVGPELSTTTVQGATLSPGAVLATLSATVLSGGTEEIASGGIASATTVSSGGRVLLSSGATLSGGTVLRGGLLSGSGTLENVGVYGSVTAAAVGDGGVLDLLSGGVATGITVLSGGTEAVASGAVARATTVSAGGVLSGAGVVHGHVADYGLVSGLRLGREAVVKVFSGAGADAVKLVSGAVLADVDGGVVSGATVYAGGVLSGFGGLAGVIADAGLVSGAALRSGGVLNVFSGGNAVGVRVASGGAVRVVSGGTASDVIVSSAATLTDNGSAIYSGASTIVLGGRLEGGGALIEDGPGVLVQSGLGATFAGTTVISGGTLEDATARGLGKGSIVFAAGSSTSATLQLQSAAEPAKSGTFASVLSNFSAALDGLDLGNRAYVSGATATVSGTTLTLLDGAYSAQFTLGGSTASGYQVTSDGHGGTLITPIVTSAMAMTHAIAGFASLGLTDVTSIPSTQSATIPTVAAPTG